MYQTRRALMFGLTRVAYRCRPFGVDPSPPHSRGKNSACGYCCCAEARRIVDAAGRKEILERSVKGPHCSESKLIQSVAGLSMGGLASCVCR